MAKSQQIEFNAKPDAKADRAAIITLLEAAVQRRSLEAPLTDEEIRSRIAEKTKLMEELTKRVEESEAKITENQKRFDELHKLISEGETGGFDTYKF
ncbi:hypothetical protein SARC_03827 [Sphaeroforma arctica JP610]|uniref:Uncharacterized protein n=1 Tax=Sphaeroforma arctica JP610 TaxID=667725 RepID=A0A0L0G6S0_9EUKA|nr:hypothetical protein SARC_03827 [Sphaeroforma arctica JP610]KNC83933.1 hypothetical protein SARC_03827 [Sphaeroforma arctica JP610]|eukprot:XP_014157835.1 hypothetical protein SARC_03827 [Sphaeroforma arctica JP610]